MGVRFNDQASTGEAVTECASNLVQQVARKGAEKVLRVLKCAVTLAQAHVHSITISQLQHCTVTGCVSVERVYCHCTRHYLHTNTQTNSYSVGNQLV